ncbi:MAG: M48 family metallopeptidase [Firmicutes bacterium]|nr:M48 family metallopeptidase [Bacillota bacterium]
MTKICFTLIRSQRKTLAIEITKALDVVVRAPARMAKRDIDRLVTERAGWIEENLEKMRARANARPPLTDADIEALKRRAREVLPARVRHYAPLLGQMPSGIRITSAATRFGSCSAQNSLCFSYHLLRYPMEAVDYVVVHELAHIAHKNHGPAFYALIAAVLPDYRARRALLRV